MPRTITQHPSPRDQIDLIKAPAVELAYQAIETAKRLPEPIRTTALEELAKALLRASRYASAELRGTLPCGE